MDIHNTHILTDGTSSGYSYKYDNSGKLIFESIDNLSNVENKKEELKDESNLAQNTKNIKINSYEKDLEIDSFDLIKIKTKQNNNEKKFNEIINKTNEIENKEENSNNDSIINLENKIKNNNKNLEIESNNIIDKNIIKLNYKDNKNSNNSNKEINNINNDNENDNNNKNNEIFNIKNKKENNNSIKYKNKSKKVDISKSSKNLNIKELFKIQKEENSKIINKTDYINIIKHNNTVNKNQKENDSDIPELNYIPENENKKKQKNNSKNKFNNGKTKSYEIKETDKSKESDKKFKKGKIEENSINNNKENIIIINNKNDKKFKNKYHKGEYNDGLYEKENQKNIDKDNKANDKEIKVKNEKGNNMIDNCLEDKKNSSPELKKENDLNDNDKIKRDIKNEEQNKIIKENYSCLILPKFKRLFITKTFNKNKIKEELKKRNNISYFPSVCNQYYFCTKINIKDKIKIVKTFSSINSCDSSSRNSHKNNSKENYNKKNFINIINKNNGKFLKIPIIKNMNKLENNKNKNHCSPAFDKIIKRNILNSEESQVIKSNKNIFNLSLIRPKNKSKKKIYNLITTKKKKNIKKIKYTNFISSLSSERIDKINTTSTNFKKYIKMKNKSSQNIINRNNDNLNFSKIYGHKNITSFHSDLTSRQKMPVHISKLNLIKESSLKKKELFKRINKKDNNIWVYINGFKRHFGKEENCPLCISRENNAEKRVKLLYENNNNFNSYCIKHKTYKNNINFSNLQDEINDNEFHKYFIKELNRNKKNDDEILLNKKVKFNKKKKKDNIRNYSMSLHLNSKMVQDKKGAFPVIFNYLES